MRGSYNPQDAEHVDIFRLLDQLEDLPEKAKHLPFNTLVGFNHEQFYYLVLKIRANLPEDMKKAQRVARDTERIVGEARDVAQGEVEQAKAEAVRVSQNAVRDAERVRKAAEAEALSMVEQSEIHRMATAQAQDLIRSAETEAIEIREGADNYARDVLTNLEAVMSKAISQVQRGRETLEQSFSGQP